MEIMVTTVIFSLIAGGIYTTFLVGVRSWTYYNESVIVKQDVRRAFFAMSQELREAKNVFINKDDVLGIALNFYRPSVGNISYSWINRGENANQVIRNGKNQKKILARNISSLSFTQETTADITIEISAVRLQKNGKEIKAYLKEKVALRAMTGIMKGAEDNL